MASHTRPHAGTHFALACRPPGSHSWGRLHYDWPGIGIRSACADAGIAWSATILHAGLGHGTAFRGAFGPTSRAHTCDRTRAATSWRRRQFQACRTRPPLRRGGTPEKSRRLIWPTRTTRIRCRRRHRSQARILAGAVMAPARTKAESASIATAPAKSSPLSVALAN
jgi:hypothetical protein